MWKINLISGLSILILSRVMRVFNLSILIAGYNTASKEYKRKYNEKKLVAYVSTFLTISAGILIAGCVISMFYKTMEEVVLTFSWVIFTIFILFAVVYLNLTDKVKAKK